jgi:hypothetical protein
MRLPTPTVDRCPATGPKPRVLAQRASPRRRQRRAVAGRRQITRAGAAICSASLSTVSTNNPATPGRSPTHARAPAAPRYRTLRRHSTVTGARRSLRFASATWRAVRRSFSAMRVRPPAQYGPVVPTINGLNDRLFEQALGDNIAAGGSDRSGRRRR